MLSNPDDARDAAQDVILRILTRLNQFDGRSGLATWVVRISMNHCLSLRRRQVIAARSLQTVADQAASRQRLADSDQIAKASGGLAEGAPSVREGGRGESLRSERSGGGKGSQWGPGGRGGRGPGGPEGEEEQGVQGEPSPAPSVQFPGSAQSRPSLLEQAWNTLDADAAAILLLRDVQDMEYEVIAIVLDIPIGTVKSRLFRARAALRAALERLSPDFRPET